MICVSITAKNNTDALEKMTRAEALADVLEIRLDLMASFDLPDIVGRANKPVIVTYRSLEQGGKGTASDAATTGCLMDAIEAGADFVDVEYRLPSEFRDPIMRNKGPSKIIVSSHLPDGTPSVHTLEDYLTKMAATGADVVKLVPLARKREDNLSVLQLIPRAREMNVEIITFCMGPLGLISRITSPILGGYLTFASLDEGEEAGAGQLPALKMKKIWETLNRCA